MAKWGSCDMSGLKKLAKQLEEAEKQKLYIKIAKNLAARLLSKVIYRTPVGDYEPGTGKQGGTLHRGWTAETEAAALSGPLNVDVTNYVNSLPVTQKGDIYEIELTNPVHYTSYVEYGHRTVNGGWVEGKYMMTLSEKELMNEAPEIIEKKILKALENLK